MPHREILLLAAALAVSTVIVGTASSAGDRATAPDAGRRAWFRSLIQPGTNDSPCCDIADCRRTTAEWHAGGWWAEVQGRWRPIPADRVLHTPTSIDGDAYVCSGDTTYADRHSPEPRIYCFVPPDMGS